MDVRKLLVGLFALALILWGPVPRSWPYPSWIRLLLYLALLPTLAWFALKLIWNKCQPDEAVEDRIERAVASAIAGALLLSSVREMKATSHLECTQVIQTRDGQECVGDYVRVPGPDGTRVILYLGVSAIAAWFGIRTPEKNQDDKLR